MIISHKYKIVFIHIPKNAGSYVTNILYNLDKDLDVTYLGHIRGKCAKKMLSPDIWDTYTKFCVIRNSWDSSISLYSYIINNKIHHMYSTFKNMSYEEYLNYKKPYRIIQTNYILDKNENKVILDYLIDFNNIQDNIIKFFHEIVKIDMDTILAAIPTEKINKSIRDENYKIYYDDNKIELVRKIYKKDIDFFSFEFNNVNSNKLLWPTRQDAYNNTKIIDLKSSI